MGVENGEGERLGGAGGACMTVFGSYMRCMGADGVV